MTRNDYYAPSIDLNVKTEEPEERFIWTSQKVEQYLDALDNGAKPKTGSPFYENNPLLRKGNLVFEYTEEELSEVKKCARDIVHFANHYCKVMTDRGLEIIKLRDYQIDMLRNYQEHRFNIVNAARQIGKTVVASIFVSWYVLFHVDRNALILANKGATTKEIIDKSKTLLENLPFFLKPGILKNDVMNMKFDNGCRIIGQSTTKKSAIGFTIHLLFMDEFAHINQSFIESFYENVYPTISSSKVSRVIITSTPNGFNKFFELFQAAMEKKNEYFPFQVDWWQVPGRDKNWMEKEILQLGSIEAFNRQYGNQFASSTTLLLSPSQVEKAKKSKIQFKHRDIPWLDDLDIKYDKLIWHPEFDTEFVNKNSTFIAFSIDLAEGDGGDASVINIFRIEPTPKELRKFTISPNNVSDFFRLKQIGIYRCNQTDTEDLAKILYILAYKMFDPDNVKIVLEWNTLGSDFKKKLETVFPKTNDFDEDLIVKFKHRIDARIKKFGLRLKRDNKTQMCVAFKKLYSQFRVEITEEDSVEELIRFGKMPDGSYKGQLGKDDIAMTCVNVGEFFKTIEFEDLVEEYFDFLDERDQSNLEDLLDAQEDKQDKSNYDIYEVLES